MRKGNFLLILIIFIVLAGSAYFFFGRGMFNTSIGPSVSTDQEVLEGDVIQLNLEDGVNLLSYGYKFALVKKETTEKINAKDLTYLFAVYLRDEQAGELEVTVREIDNGDKFVFSRFERMTEQSATIPIKLVFSKQGTYTFLPFEEEIEQEHDRVFGIDYTTNVKGLYTIGDKESQYDLYLSQNYISTELRAEYEDGSHSVLRELVNEDKYIDIRNEKNDLAYHLELRTTAKEQISENWFIVSKERLFSDVETAEFFKERMNYHFLSSPKWLTATGNYTKLPWSIEPSTKLGYGRNLVRLQGNLFINHYHQTPERFFYSMLVNSVNYIWDYKGDKDLWETEYTSTWLKREYGIIAPYTDTRHNENIALFLSEAGKILNRKELVDAYLLYANFLCNQEEIGNILKTDNGYYILDYYSKNQLKKTHVSLNHALGEMNYLFNAYKNTNHKQYLDVALKIKHAVEDIGVNWINESNGDLWYQINSDYSFEGKDYDTLTLEDLVVAVTNYKELNLSYSNVYEQLINSKLNYIIENDLEISKALYNNLVKLGYEQLLKNWAKPPSTVR